MEFPDGHYLQRRHERFNKKIEYQIDMCLSYISAAATWTRLAQAPENDEEKRRQLTDLYIKQLEAVQIKIRLFGNQGEMNAIQELTQHAQRNEHEKLDAKGTELSNSMRRRLRKEMGIGDIGVH